MSEMNFLKKAGLIVYDPNKFFKEIKKERGISESLIFVSAIFVLAGAFMFMFMDPESYHILNFVPVTSALLIVLANVSLVFPISYLIYLSCKFFKGKGDYKETYRVVAYSSLPNLIMFLPYLGPILALVWIIFLDTIGLAYIHGIKSTHAAIASIISNLVLLAITGIITYFLIN